MSQAHSWGDTQELSEGTGTRMLYCLLDHVHWKFGSFVWIEFWIWTASPSVVHAHPPFSNGTLLKCLHLIQVCTCVTDHSNKKLLLLKLTQLCMYLESDPLMHVHVYQANHCKIHPNCIRGSEDHPGLAMRLLLIYIFCCLLALSCWHFYSYSNNLSNIRYTCICSPKSMSSRGSIVISLKSKKFVTKKKWSKDAIKYLQSRALREHICKLEEGERERRQGLKAPHEGQRVDNLRKASGMLLGKPGRCRIIQRHVRALNCVPFPMEKWNKFGNTRPAPEPQFHGKLQGKHQTPQPRNPSTPIKDFATFPRNSIPAVPDSFFHDASAATLCYNIVCVAQHNKSPFWCVSKDVAKVC